MPRMLMLVATGAALAACTTSGGAGGPPPTDDRAPVVADAAPAGRRPVAPGGCNAEAAAFAVGQAYTEALRAEAQRAAGAKTARALPPGLAVTMEFNPDRLNLVLDAERKVVRVTCG